MTAIEARTESTTPVRATRVTNGKELGDYLAQYADKIADVIPRHLTPDRLIKMACIASNGQPKLLQCTLPSIVQSVMKSAELGLDCSGTLGEAYLVPYKHSWKDESNRWQSELRCQLIPGYRGLIKLARQGGQVAKISAHVAYAKDEFYVELGTTDTIVHRPYMDGDRGEMRAVYAVATLNDGSTQSDWMPKADVDKIRARSKAKDNGPWNTDYDEMARKTVVKRLCKYLPSSTERDDLLRKAIDIDNEATGIDTSPSYRVTRSSETSATEDLARRLTGNHETPEYPEPAEEVIDATNGDDMPPIDDPCPVSAAQVNARITDITRVGAFKVRIARAVCGMDRADESLSKEKLLSAADALDRIAEALKDRAKPENADAWTEFCNDVLGG